MKAIGVLSVIICVVTMLPGCMSFRTTPARSATLVVGDALLSERFEIAGNTAKKTVSGPNGSVQKRQSYRLEEADVENFWSIMERTAIDQWKARYTPTANNGRTHTTSWELSTMNHGRRFVSQGHAAFPADGDPRKTTQLNVSIRFQQVYEAFKKLTPEQARH